MKRRSTCKRVQQACIITDRDFDNIVAIGYNGVGSGEDNDSCTREEGNCGCVHAEMNAIAKLNSSHTYNVLMCITSPCKLCARLIVNSKRIGKVIYLNKYRDTQGIDILKDCGISVVQRIDISSV